MCNALIVLYNVLLLLWTNVSLWITAFRYPTQASAISKCPSGYNEVAGSCFRVIETAMDFNGAQATCQVDGANLASISSQYEQMSIEIETKDITGAIWIGLKLEVFQNLKKKLGNKH